MTMTLTSSPIATEPAGAWIDLETASRRSGRSIGHLARRCGDVWMAHGLAEFRQVPGQKSKWFVNENADAAFTRLAARACPAFDMRTLTDAQRSELLRREQIVKDWETARAGGVRLGFTIDQTMSQFVSRLECEGRAIHAATVFRWAADYKSTGRAGLVDGRWNVQFPRSTASGEFLEEVKRLYLDQRRRSIKLCYDRAADLAQEKGWPICSYKTAQRAINAIPKRTRDLKRFGDKKYDAKHGPYIQRDYSLINSNDLWESDHHRFDVWVLCPDGQHRRPWLTAWIDVRSRLLVGHIVKDADPCAATILRSFGGAGGAHGFPVGVHIDNGNDYRSFILKGMTRQQQRRIERGEEGPAGEAAGAFKLLDIGVRHARPYNAKAKTIERFFGTVCGRFSRLWETYCGRNPEERPDDLKKWLAHGRAPTLAEFQAGFDSWLVSDYHNNLHDGDAMSMTPPAAHAAFLERKRVLSRDVLALALMIRTQPLKVGRNGVTYRGLGYGQFEPALIPLAGQEVFLRVDDADLRQVHVYKTDGSFICIAASNQRLSVVATDDEIREANAAIRRDKRARRAGFQAGMRMADSLIDRVHRRAAAIADLAAAVGGGGGGMEPSPPPSLSPIRTPLESQAAAIRAAVEARSLAATGTEDAQGGPRQFTYTPNWSAEEDL